MRESSQRQSEFEEKIIQISRVSKKTKGGNKIGFSVLVVVGDKNGRVGVALGKAPTVAAAIHKGSKKAKKKLITVPMNGATIPFKIEVKKGAGRVLLKPAPKGSGVIAGGPVRAVVDAAGIRDISSKIMGSQNQASSVYATFAALKEIERIVKLKGINLKCDVGVSPANKKSEIIAKPPKKDKPAVKVAKQVIKKVIKKSIKSVIEPHKVKSTVKNKLIVKTTKK